MPVGCVFHFASRLAMLPPVCQRYAELHPEEVDGIFMLCPSFGLGTRAKTFGSEAEMAEWERTGARGKECGVSIFKRRARLAPVRIILGDFDEEISLEAISLPIRKRMFSTFVHTIPTAVAHLRRRFLESPWFCSIEPHRFACSPEVFPLSTGGEASVPWAFVREAMMQKNYPEYRCAAAIVHGLRDEVVPAAATRSLVEGR